MDIPSGFKLVPDESKAVTPEARGKSAAFDRWAAQGGQPGKDGTYRKGPMKGMTFDQATQKFESMWASAPTAIKEKYASRARSGAAPSEIEEAAQRNGRTTVAPPQRPEAMYADQKAARMSSYGTKHVNPAATSGSGRGAPVKVVAPTPVAPQTPETNPAMKGPSRPVAGAAPTPVVPQYPETNPIMQGAPRPAPNAALERQFPGLAEKAVTPPVVGSPVPVKPAAAVAPDGSAPGKAPRINSLTGLPMGYRPGDAVAAPMQAQADASVARQSTAPQIARPAPVTSVARPTALQSSGINRPRTLAPGTNTVEGHAADEMRRQAAINANPSTVNPDDPRKFFTGKVKPLTELVRQRA